MARGWESKSVEEQQSQLAERNSKRRIDLTPQERTTQRARDGLILSRKHVLQELEVNKNSGRRKMLESALADLDHKLAQLG